MEACFVTFYSPGTLVAEQTTKPINSWDVDAAIEMARGIKERHSAIPYGFCFTTRRREDDELDSHEVERSNFYWLGGDVLTLAEIKERNGWDRVIENNNSWRWTQPPEADDVILNY